MSVLTNILPPRVRQTLYAGLVVAAAIFAAYQAADGDWGVFVGSALTSLISLMAASNIQLTDEPPVDENHELGAFSLVAAVACLVMLGLFLGFISALGWI